MDVQLRLFVVFFVITTAWGQTSKLDITISADNSFTISVSGQEWFRSGPVTLPMVPPQSVPPDQVRQPWMVPPDHARLLHLVQGGPSTALSITTLGPPLPRTVPHRRTIH